MDRTEELKETIRVLYQMYFSENNSLEKVRAIKFAIDMLRPIYGLSEITWDRFNCQMFCNMEDPYFQDDKNIRDYLSYEIKDIVSKQIVYKITPDYNSMTNTITGHLFVGRTD